LTQDVTSLEIQPTFEDVFHADTSTVDEYLRQVEESTILAAIQASCLIQLTSRLLQKEPLAELPV
jgi:hypothetical protein